ncbi:MAG: hypothetical protein WCO57_12070 [Verrucomicrobiota bacterium]
MQSSPLLFLAMLAAALTHPSVMAAAPDAVPTSPGHAFACTDYVQGKVFIISKEGKIEWEYPAQNANDLAVMPNGNLLFNTGHGVREVTRTKEIVFDYQSKSEIYTCQRLPDGNTFVGECGSGRLLILNPKAEIVREVRLLPAGKDGGHAYMRCARVLANGHFLVAHFADKVVKEYDATGKVLREISAAGGPHSVIRLANGNTVISCGDAPGGSRVFEVDPQGLTVWQVQGDEVAGHSLKFPTGIQRLPNGNTLICNWLGHGQFGKSPHLVEVTPDKRAVWSFADHKAVRTISNVVLLDETRTPAVNP